MPKSGKKKKRAGRKNPQVSVPIRETNLSRAGRTLEKAAGLYFQKKLDKCLTLLQSLELSELTEDSDKLNYHRLLAFAYANNNDFAEAELEAQKGMAINNEDRDFYFVLAYVYSSYKDYDKCLGNA
jgi:hypothetical protein